MKTIFLSLVLATTLSAQTTPEPKEGRFHGKISIAGKRLLGLMDWVETLLIPSQAEFVKKLTYPVEIGARVTIYKEKDKAGCFYATADAEGDVVINHVPPGKYTFLVFTREKARGPAERTAAKRILAKYFTDKYADFHSEVRIAEIDVEILPGEETKKAYYFDN